MENKTSLAVKINRYWLRKTAFAYAFLNIVLILFSSAAWCRMHELEQGISAYNISRKLLFDSTAKGIWNYLGSAVYHFEGYTAEAGIFIKTLVCIFIAISLIELLMLVFSSSKGHKNARKLLRPINEMAISTNAIAAAELTPQEMTAPLTKPEEHSDVDFSDLQFAIDKTDPMAATYIHTGNSDLKGLEDAVNNLLDRMRDAYMRQTQFVSDASHELRTPIAVIQGYAKMLDRWGKTDEKVLDESITALKSESDHIAKLVEQLLFLARGDNGRQTMNMDVFSVSDMMREICSEYRLIDESHAYLLDIKGEFKAYGDASMIKQAVRILTDNAKKYTPAGGEITLCARRTVSGDICFEVQDTGIGMEQNDIEHIFERFYRADPARNRDTGGTGLGLSIAKWIIDRHNGHFDISSCVGIGTRMAVIMPKISLDEAEFMLDDEKKVKNSLSVMSVMLRR